MQHYASQYENKEQLLSEEEQEQKDYDYKVMTSYISGMFNLSFGIGKMSGSFLGPLTATSIGYKGFTDLFAGLTVLSLLVFIIFNLLHKVWYPGKFTLKGSPKDRSLNGSGEFEKMEQHGVDSEPLLD